MGRLRISLNHVEKLKPVARVSAMALGSVLSTYFGPLGAYTGFVMATVFGDVISDLIGELGPKVVDEIEESLQRELEEKFALTGFGSIAVIAYKNTLNELEREYLDQYYGTWGRIKKPEDVRWFDCVRKRLDEKLSEQKAVVPQTVTEFDERKILDFLLSLECSIDERLRTFLEKRFVEVLTENLIKTANMNDNFRVKFDIAVLETLKENFRDLKKVEVYLRGLRNVAELNISGIEGKISERVEELLNKPFKGREEIWEKIGNIISATTSGKIIITGPAGIGKSTLMAHIVNELSRKKDVFVVPYFFDSSGGRTEVSTALRFILAKLYLENIEAEIEGSILNFDGRTLADTISGLLLRKPKKKTVIIIDALDEADAREMNSIGYPFPRKMPENVYLIISVRGDSENLEIPGTLQMVKDWTDGAEIIELKNLGFKAVRALVKESLGIKGEKLNDISRAIYEKTSGHPLYLEYLIEDLKKNSSENWLEILLKTPENFLGYMSDQLDQIMLKVASNAKLVANVFALLSYIKDPMEIGEIAEILDADPFDLRIMPHEVKRWLYIRKKGIYEFWAFQHEAIKENFGTILDDRGYLSRAMDKLLKHCSKKVDECLLSKIEKNKSFKVEEYKFSYCLKHYPEHLYEAGRYDELLELVKNQRFLEAQRRYGTTLLVLRTLDLGIDAAIIKKDVVELTKVALVYNRIYQNMLRKTFVLEFLKYYKEFGLDSILAILETEPDDIRRLRWYLLLAIYLVYLGEDNTVVEDILRTSSYIAYKYPAHREVAVFIRFLLKKWNELELYSKTKLRVLTLIFWHSLLEHRMLIDTVMRDEYFGYSSDELLFNFVLEMDDFTFTQEIKDPNVHIRALIWNAYIFKRKGNLEKAVKILDNALRIVQNTEMNVEDIIRACLWIGCPEKALQITQELKNPDLSVLVLIEVAKALTCLKKEDTENSLRILHRAFELSQKISDCLSRFEIEKDVIRGFVIVGHLEKALEIIKESGRDDCFQDDYFQYGFMSVIINTLIELGDLYQALRITQKVRGNFYRVQALVNVARGFVEKKDIKNANQVLNESLSIARKIKSSKRRISSLISISEVFIKMRDSDKALQILNEAFNIAQESEDVGTDKLGELAWAFGKIGDFKIAIQVLEEAFKRLEKFEHPEEMFCDFYLIDGILQEIGLLLYKIGELENAFELFQKMEEPGRALQVICKDFISGGHLEIVRQFVQEIDDSYTQDEILIDIIKFLVKRGDRERTLDFGQRINNEILRDIVLTLINRGLKSKEELNMVFRTIQEIPDDVEREIVLLYVCELLIELGYISYAHEISQKIESCDKRIDSLIVLANAMYQKGDLKGATRILEDALHCAQKIRDGSSHGGAVVVVGDRLYEYRGEDKFMELAKSFAMIGEVDKALDIALGIDNPYYRIKSVIFITKTLGYPKKMFTILDHMLTQEYKNIYKTPWLIANLLSELPFQHAINLRSFKNLLLSVILSGDLYDLVKVVVSFLLHLREVPDISVTTFLLEEITRRCNLELTITLKNSTSNLDRLGGPSPRDVPVRENHKHGRREQDGNVQVH